MADKVTSPVITLSGDNAIPIPKDLNEVIYFLTKGSAAAITIGVPTVGTDDGKKVAIISGSAFSHVVTQGTDGFNAKGSSGTVTFAGLGGTCRLIAHNGHWWTGTGVGLNGFTTG